MIPKDKIEEIKLRASIVDIVSDYVNLRRRGRNLVGLCPFHSEKTPSFTVSEEKNLYHCFGCHASGDAIDFLVRYERLSFVEAVRAVAAKYGIEVEERKGGGGAASDEVARLVEANALAGRFFTEELMGPAGAAARRYLKGRGFGREVVTAFGVGYAPDRWDGLLSYLKAGGVDPATAEKAGLLVKKGEGRYYDRFRGRIVFPIRDTRGRIVAFGGRTVVGAEPKYLNSPESPLFRKNQTLYGLYEGREQIRKSGAVLVAEGYFDLIALHRAGFRNSVATMGTAMTAAHFHRLKGYAGKVYTIFDSDEAGVKAALRVLGPSIEAGVDAMVVLLPEGEDPDDFLRRRGAAALDEAVAKAGALMDFFLDGLRDRFDTASAGGKAKALEEALPYLTALKNVAVRDHYAVRTATVLSLNVASVYEAMRSVGRRKRRAGYAFAEAAPSSRSEAARRAAAARNTRRIEETLLRVLMAHPELHGERTALALRRFNDPLLKGVACALADFLDSGRRDVRALLDEIDGEETRAAAASLLVSDEDGFIEEPGRMLDDCTAKLLDAGKVRAATIETTVKKAREAGLDELAARLIKRIEGGRKKNGLE